MYSIELWPRPRWNISQVSFSIRSGVGSVPETIPPNATPRPMLAAYRTVKRASMCPSDSRPHGGSTSVTTWPRRPSSSAASRTARSQIGSISASIGGLITSPIRSLPGSRPTAFANGRCTAQSLTGGPQVSGCRYWIMFADNSKPQTTLPAPLPQTPDIISFLVFDKTGKRVAYGTGPVVKGNIDVSPTTF